MTPENQQSNNKTRSNGEKAFDWATYGGLAGVGTFVVTVPVADWILYGKGEKYYNAATKWVTQKGVNPKVAGGLLLTTALMQGGNIMLAPVWAAEQVREPIVNTINKITGDPTRPEDIAEKPKQTARSLIEGRLTAFGAVFAGLTGASMVFGKQMANFETAMGRAAAGFMNRPTHELKMVDGAAKQVPTKTFRYGKTLAVDAFATITAAGLLYVASRFFAKSSHQKEMSKTDQAKITAETESHQAALTNAAPPEIESSAPQSRIAQASHEGMAQTRAELALS